MTTYILCTSDNFLLLQSLREKIYHMHGPNKEYINVSYLQNQHLYLNAATGSYVQRKLNFWTNQINT